MKKSFLLPTIIFVVTQFCFLQNTGAQTWQALSSGIGTGAGDNSSIVESLCSEGVNLYAGGQFSVAGGNSANNIAGWNGTEWSALSSGLGAGDPDADVFAMAVYNGNLYAAGIFTTAGGNTAYNIAEWNGSNWLALGLGIGIGANDSTSEVTALAVYNGKLYVAGMFNVAGGQAADNIAAWDGSSWSALGAGLGGSYILAPIAALTVYNGNLYASGGFDTAGTFAANNIAQWNGTNWSPVGLGITTTGGALSMAVYDSALYVGGYFDTAGDVPATNIAQWNGSSWSAVGSGIGANEIAEVITLVANNDILYAGGSFELAGNIAANNVGQWNGSSWAALSSGIETSGDVYASAIYNGNVYMAGYFTTAGGHTAYNIAEWETTTGINEINKNGNIIIYPNPSKGSITFAIQDGDNAQQLQIYDLTGVVVYQSIITSSKTLINISKEAAGPYFYRITSATGELIASGKVIVQ